MLKSKTNWLVVDIIPYSGVILVFFGEVVRDIAYLSVIFDLAPALSQNSDHFQIRKLGLPACGSARRVGAPRRSIIFCVRDFF